MAALFSSSGTAVIVILCFILITQLSAPTADGPAALRRAVRADLQRTLQPLEQRLTDSSTAVEARLAALEDKLALQTSQANDRLRRLDSEVMPLRVKLSEQLDRAHEQNAAVLQQTAELLGKRRLAMATEQLPPSGLAGASLPDPLVYDPFGCPIRVPYVNNTLAPLSNRFLSERAQFLRSEGIKCRVLEPNLPIVHLPHFIEPDLADYIVEQMVPRLKRSRVLEGGQGSKAKTVDGRTSLNGWLHPGTDPRLVDLYTRVSYTTGVHISHMEAIQGLRYQIGQEYRTHSDGGFRQATFYIYLSDVEEGGETMWPYTKGADGQPVKAKPVKGDAAMWFHHNTNGTLMKLAEHHALPVVKGTKWGGTFFLYMKRQAHYVDRMEY
eukprot:TRINITY_DN18313_c0_g1_i1.p1 TRINITY_DN18313_c0_g1~~TRINITY_DN18313_c0_g1_i1.p1  ORF type:complete len:401 (-),score=84.34 TRINITY_DN18313_c0_g1_i1:108-1253(-)